MDVESLRVVQGRCSESRRQIKRFKAVLSTALPATLRVDFARRATDLALEHHSAFVRLVAAEEYGSAAALLRPILEASTIGYWITYVAPLEKIQRLAVGTEDNPVEDVPLLSEMAEALLPVFPPIQGLVHGFKRGGAAKWLHKYAHGGTPQLNRRIGPGWEEGEVVLGLIRADLFSTLAGCLETVLAPNQALRDYAFNRRDELAEELRAKFGGPAIPAQPHTLPPSPLLDAERNTKQ